MQTEQSTIPPVSRDKLRQEIRELYLADEARVIEALIGEAGLGQ